MNRIPGRSALIGGLAVLAALAAGGIALADEERPPRPAPVSVDESITSAQDPDREDCPDEGAGAGQGAAEGDDNTSAAGL